MFLSPLGLGSLLIGHSRRSRRRLQRPCPSRTVKAVVIPAEFSFIPNSAFMFGLKPRGRIRKQTKEETRKKKKKRRGNDWCDTTSESSTSILNLNDDDKEIAIREILSRLLVKSLMRFECVCKHWFILIQEDSSFRELHLNRSKARPGLFMACRMDVKDIFMTADLSFEGRSGIISAAVVNTIKDVDDTLYDRILEPVNGLIGFFGQEITPGVRISNLSTREETPWIKSKLLSKIREEERGYSGLSIPLADCKLGYDPATQKHKVLGIWKSYQPDFEVCEVLTVGDNKWRKIDEIPPYGIHYYGSSVYLNGSIYYTTHMLTSSKPDDNDEPKFIVAFDVGSEKFRAIEVPNFIFDGPGDGDFVIFRSVKLLVLDGRLALLVRVQKKGSAPKLWLSGDDCVKENASGTWTEVPLELPFTLDGVQRWRGSFHPVLGTDQMVVTSTVLDGKICDATHHSYNWKKMGASKIDISGIPTSVPYFSSATSRITTFFESLISVRRSRPCQL